MCRLAGDWTRFDRCPHIRQPAADNQGEVAADTIFTHSILFGAAAHTQNTTIT